MANRYPGHHPGMPLRHPPPPQTSRCSPHCAPHCASVHVPQAPNMFRPVFSHHPFGHPHTTHQFAPVVTNFHGNTPHMLMYPYRPPHPAYPGMLPGNVPMMFPVTSPGNQYIARLSQTLTPVEGN